MSGVEATAILPSVLMPDLDIQVIAEVTSIPVEKVRGIVWLAEKHMREKCLVVEPVAERGDDGWATCPEHGPDCLGETCCCVDKHRAEDGRTVGGGSDGS